MNAQIKEAQQEQQASQDQQQFQAPENLLDQVVKQTQDLIVTEKGLDYANFTGLWKLATMIYRSKMYPHGLDSIESIALVIARGRPIGLDAFQSMESMAVVNGKVVIYGDAPLAICRQHAAWEEAGFDEYFEHNGQRIDGTPQDWNDTTTAVCVTLRGVGKPRITKFTVKDAKTAALWNKKGKNGESTPWCTYPQRLMMFRARGYNLRDNFGDALKGIAIRELHEDDEIGTNPTPGAIVPLPTGKGKLADLTEQLKGKEAQPSATPEPTPKATAPEKAPTPTDNGQGKDADLQKARKEVKDALALLNLPDDVGIAEALKQASLIVKDGGESWLGFEHLDTVKNVRWLQMTAKKLQAAKTQAAPAAEPAQEALNI